MNVSVLDTNITEIQFKNLLIPIIKEYMRKKYHFHVRDDKVGKYCVKYFDQIEYRNVTIYYLDKIVPNNFKSVCCDTNAERDALLLAFESITTIN